MRPKLPDAANLHVGAEDLLNLLSLGYIDDQLAIHKIVPKGTRPPIHMPLRLEAAILSWLRSPVTSRSNCANDSSTFKVSRPIDKVVLNCWVTETKLTLSESNT